MESRQFVFNEPEWNTNRTYGDNYKQIPERPGVYFLVQRNIDVINNVVYYTVLYVGSSKNLKVRHDGHEVLRVLNEIYDDVIFYFKEIDNYLEAEKQLIKLTQARFNKQWR